MMLLTPELRAALRANDEARRAAVMAGLDEPDFVPIAKFFNPMGAATWLATELGEDGDTLFGLADLGFGCPELGYFSLSEIRAVRLPYGLWIERQPGFTTPFPLSLRSEEHTSELQSLMRISYAVFCLKKTKIKNIQQDNNHTIT